MNTWCRSQQVDQMWTRNCAGIIKKQTRIFAWNAGLPLMAIAFGLTSQRIVLSLDVLVNPREGNFKTSVLDTFFIRPSWILWKRGYGTFFVLICHSINELQQALKALLRCPRNRYVRNIVLIQ